MTARPRHEAIDLLRGLVMAVMALDHTRDYFSGARGSPTDLATTTAPLFLTRWVTHYCAPVFVLLAGTAAYLYGARGRTKPELARFLATRGLWLVLLELTVVRFAWLFDLSYRVVILQVIWAIGWSMVALAALVFLPTRVVGAVGVAMIASHNLLDGVRGRDLGAWRWLWALAHEHQLLRPASGPRVMVVYPLVPWIGVMAAGYAMGAWAALDAPARRRRWALAGAAMVALFVVLRATNLYGDPHPWAPQRSAVFTALSFLNCEKYPPSLLYLLMTLGPALLALAAFDRLPAGSAWARPFVTLGRVPLFYYVAHLYLIHAAAGAITLARGAAPAYGLPGVYLAWACVVAALYPACRWFAALKARRRDAWLSYL